VRAQKLLTVTKSMTLADLDGISDHWYSYPPSILNVQVTGGMLFALMPIKGVRFSVIIVFFSLPRLSWGNMGSSNLIN
jgi:hypothetical protein